MLAHLDSIIMHQVFVTIVKKDAFYVWNKIIVTLVIGIIHKHTTNRLTM